jgi:hypothetical protein
MSKNGEWKSGNIPICLKRCVNRGELCKDCIMRSGKPTNFKAYFYDEIKEIDKILNKANEQEDGKNVQ